MDQVFFLTYRKAKPNAELPHLPDSAFHLYQGECDGEKVEYKLADSGIYIDYGRGRKRHRLHLRQITCRRKNGEQTHVVTNDRASGVLLLAQRMFKRWGQENFFKYMDPEMEFDGLLSYTMEDADGDREVPKPREEKAGQEDPGA